MKINKIRRFTSSYENEIDLVVDLILKMNEVIRKLNLVIEQGNFHDTEED